MVSQPLTSQGSTFKHLLKCLLLLDCNKYQGAWINSGVQSLYELLIYVKTYRQTGYSNFQAKASSKHLCLDTPLQKKPLIESNKTQLHFLTQIIVHYLELGMLPKTHGNTYMNKHKQNNTVMPSPNSQKENIFFIENISNEEKIHHYH